MNLKDAIKDAATKWKATQDVQFVWAIKDGFMVCAAGEGPKEGGNIYGKIDRSGNFVMLDG